MKIQWYSNCAKKYLFKIRYYYWLWYCNSIYINGILWSENFQRQIYFHWKTEQLNCKSSETFSRPLTPRTGYTHTQRDKQTRIHDLRSPFFPLPLPYLVHNRDPDSWIIYSEYGKGFMYKQRGNRMNSCLIFVYGK